MLFILLFIFILNVVAIVLTYKFLPDMEKRDRIIFVGVGIAIIYMLTSLVYWISTKNVKIEEVSNMGKNIITFMFVPINSIAVLPIIAKSYNKYKIGRLAADKLRNRVIAISIPLIIILIIECIYFKNIQDSVVKLIEQNAASNADKQIMVNMLNEQTTNETTNETANNHQELQANEIANTATEQTNSVNVQKNSTVNDVTNTTNDKQGQQENNTNN